VLLLACWEEGDATIRTWMGSSTEPTLMSSSWASMLDRVATFGRWAYHVLFSAACPIGTRGDVGDGAITMGSEMEVMLVWTTRDAAACCATANTIVESTVDPS
jgi:hypothetical protein